MIEGVKGPRGSDFHEAIKSCAQAWVRVQKAQLSYLYVLFQSTNKTLVTDLIKSHCKQYCCHSLIHLFDEKTLYSNGSYMEREENEMI